MDEEKTPSPSRNKFVVTAVIEFNMV